MHLVTLTCPSCGEARRFQRPPCPDGHGDDCPDRACVDCGTALLIGFLAEQRTAPVATGYSSAAIAA
ncbi:MAG: hypothetical protein GEV11_17750 [Streptosporangiales bacterium]|nr:hypothetical protein [Streptosporangiales bacterium]